MSTLIDLSHPLIHGQPSYPGDPALSMMPHATLARDGYNLTRLELGTHQGTHLDAPFHFDNNGLTIEAIPLDRFYGPASIIDLAPGGCLEPGTLLTIEMFEPHESLFEPGSRVIYRTGWDRWFGDPVFFIDYPSLTPYTSRWMAEKEIGLLGMDTPSPSVEAIDSHGVLLQRGKEIIIVESLANLHRLPPHFTFIAFPLNLDGCDGSPVRVVAVVD